MVRAVVDHSFSKAALLWVFIRSPGESLTFGNISVPGPDRIDNLLKVHS